MTLLKRCVGACTWRPTMRNTTIRLSHTAGYQSMGSFHSEDVDELMAQGVDVYVPPTLPFEAISESEVPTTSDFLLDRSTWTFLNHGAFGAALRVGYDRAEQWRYHLEQQPLRYFDRDLLPHLVYSARQLAEFCHAPREAMTLIPNVTFGLNTVIRGYTREYKDQAHIILWDTSYGSLKKIAKQCCAKVTEVPVSDYFSQCGEFDDPKDIFELALAKVLESEQIDTKNALLILDHTTSNTAVNMPLESLSKFGKEHNMLVMVDGAHSLLAQQISLAEYPFVDFYLANGHKWLSCTRGVAIMYCSSQELRDSVLAEPAVMSHGIGQGFQNRFLWDGCRDYSAALMVPAALDYWRKRDVATVQHDIHEKLHQAVEILGRSWHGTEDGVTLVPLDMHSPMMALVRLPSCLQRQPAATSDDAKRIQDFLYDQFIEVPIKCVNGVLYVRISCHVYNELSEYERLAHVVSLLESNSF